MVRPLPRRQRIEFFLAERIAVAQRTAEQIAVTIQKGNPYADPLRRRLVDELSTLEHKLQMSTETGLKAA